MKITDFPQLHAFKVDIDYNHVAEISLNRPEAINSMNSDFWAELPAIIEALEREAAARVIILSSQGQHFTAGMDLSVFDNLGRSNSDEPARAAEKSRRWILELQDTFTALENTRMPVISAIQGACIGGGVDMICATDMRFCTSNAYFNIKETALGITADVGTLQRIQNVMPSGLARELAYSSRNLGAEEALAFGFVNKVYCDQEEMLGAVRSLAAEIAAHSPMAVHGTKEMLNYSRDHSVQDSLNHMATWQSGMLQTHDIHEAMQANSEKRTPKFGNLLPRVIK
ncbi:MAG: crotonase/enoyl-CoA hydratase family protein [Porticoccaceae bacterium]|nr:crotonase/enoyl-CoA hydratase family protein [Porticoccaceae bacterium]